MVAHPAFGFKVEAKGVAHVLVEDVVEGHHRLLKCLLQVHQQRAEPKHIVPENEAAPHLVDCLGPRHGGEGVQKLLVLEVVGDDYLRQQLRPTMLAREITSRKLMPLPVSLRLDSPVGDIVLAGVLVRLQLGCAYQMSLLLQGVQ